MLNKKHKITILMVALMFSMLLQVESYGQKRTKKKSKVLSEEEIYQSDFYFIEAEKFYLIEDYAKALDMFNRSLEINEKNGAAHYKIAEIYVQDEKYLEALPHAIKAKEIDPDNKYYYILNARLNEKLGDFESAALNFEELFKRFEGNDDYLLDLADIYESLNEKEKAIEVYDRIEHVYGQYLQITQQKAKTYLELKMPEKAKDEWLKLIAFSTESAHYTGYIKFLIEQQEVDEAIKVIDQAIIDNPEDNSLLFLSSNSEFEKGNLEKSVETLKKPFSDRSVSPNAKVRSLVKFLPQLEEGTIVADRIMVLCDILIKMHPEENTVYSLTGDINYQLKREDEALRYFLLSLERDESRFELWQKVLTIELQSRKYDSVIVHAEKAKEVFPNQAILYYYKGSAYFNQKQYKEAVYEMERGVRYARRTPELQVAFYGQLGDSYNALGNYQKSDASYEKALQLDPGNEYTLNNYSYYLSLRGEKLEAAESMSASLIEKFPDNASYLDTYGWVLYKSGKLKEAKRIFERAVKLNGAGGIIFEHYGDVLFKLGRKEEALAQWQKAKEVGSASNLIDKKIADRKLYE